MKMFAFYTRDLEIKLFLQIRTRKNASVLNENQWRREGICRPGQTSVLPPPPHPVAYLEI